MVKNGSIYLYWNTIFMERSSLWYKMAALIVQFGTFAWTRQNSIIGKMTAFRVHWVTFAWLGFCYGNKMAAFIVCMYRITLW